MGETSIAAAFSSILRAPVLKGRSEVSSLQPRDSQPFFGTRWSAYGFVPMIPYVQIMSPMIKAAIEPLMVPRATVAC